MPGESQRTESMEGTSVKRSKKIKKRLKKTVGKVVNGGDGRGKVVAAGLATAGAIGLGVATVRKRRGNAITELHVVPNGDEGWAITVEGESKPISFHSRKQSAVSAGREEARQREPSTLVIHGQDGTVQESHSYGTDGS